MKLVVNLKITDVVVQALAFLTPIIISVLPTEVIHSLRSEAWMSFYFVVGAVQFTSCGVNRIFLNKAIRGHSRIGYEVLLGVITLLAIATWVLPNGREIGGVLLFFLIFVSPIMAIWYFILSINEVLNAMTYIKPTPEKLELSSSYDQIL
jgi:hypothetical protein